MSVDKSEKKVAGWLRKVSEVRGAGNNGLGMDLSRDEDLSIALMNIISLEEHFYFTAMKTDDAKYLAMLTSVREIRKRLLAEIVKNPKGEEWCISKHLLAASMRLIEVGTKELAKSGKADMYFHDAFELYSLFFSINIGSGKAVTEMKQQSPSQKRGDEKSVASGGFSAVVKKIVDCCKE